MTSTFKISLILLLGIISLVAFISNFEVYIHPLFNFFLYSIPSNAAISLFPHEPVLVLLGKSFDPLLLALVGILGTIVAGILDYFIFVPLFSSSVVDKLKNTTGYIRATRWFDQQPFWTIVIAGFTPIPFFPFKFVAFSTKYPIGKYLLSLVIGRYPRYYLLALLGYSFNIPETLIIVVFIIMLMFFMIQLLPQLIKR
ncbi:MAG: VTT domain-containing protein [Candidatus Marinimicrobia bacterium]|nr:VTT domain-containing protein [Candidatus Neomarinimicrobiota bacterium]